MNRETIRAENREVVQRRSRTRQCQGWLAATASSIWRRRGSVNRLTDKATSIPTAVVVVAVVVVAVVVVIAAS